MNAQPPVQTGDSLPHSGPGAERLRQGEPLPSATGKPAPIEEIVKSYDPEEGYLTRHEPTAADLFANAGPYTDKDQNKYDVGKSILEAAKEFLFIADDAGEPLSATSTPGLVHMTWDDGSAVTVRFEARRGELGAASAHPSEPERKSRNLAYSKAKEAKEAQRQHKEEARGQKEEARSQKLGQQDADEHKRQEQQKHEAEQHKAKNQHK